jgi:hypothetical protein
MFRLFDAQAKVPGEYTPEHNTLAASDEVSSSIVGAQFYTVIVASMPRTSVDIKEFFNGNMDENYKVKQYFDSKCEVYGNLDIAATKNARRGGATPQSVYVLAMGYALDKVKLLAKKGEFSKCVLYAIDAKILHHKPQDIPPDAIIKNENFDPNLLRTQEAAGAPSL